MSYHRRKRRRKYYGEYYSDSRLQTYFSPIIQDLKTYFFTMPSTTLEKLLLDYKEKYGEKAYSYALYAYPKWRAGYTKMSDQTLLRIVETLPYFLSENERLSLLEKLFSYFVQKTSPQHIYESATWDDYETILDDIYHNIYHQYATYYKPIDFQQEILDLATWLTNDDMEVAKKILSQYSLNKYRLHITNIYNDIKRFKYLCKRLKSQDLVYNEQSLILKLPMVTIYFTLQAKNKSILKRISDFFA